MTVAVVGTETVPPLTTPVIEMVAVGGVKRSHTPPEAMSPRAVVLPEQTVNVPVIGPGTGLTVTRVVV